MALLRYLLNSHLILLLLAIRAFGYQEDTTTYKVKWGLPTKIIIQGKAQEIIDFYAAFHRKENSYLPTHLIVQKGYFSSVEVTDIESEDLTEADKKALFDIAFVSSAPKVFITHSTERNFYNTKVEILPLFKNVATGQVQKITRFRLRWVEGVGPSIAVPPARAQHRISQAEASVLSQGNWYKLAFSQSGIYKIDYNYLKSIGIDPARVNPARIQIWGNGGKMLPENTMIPRPVDLLQSPIVVVGEEDGVFNENDYILFYVQGPNSWYLDETENLYSALPHLYSNFAYYFITVGTNNGARITKSSISNDPSFVFNSYSARETRSMDERNFLFSGRKWYGDEFDNITSRTYTFPIRGLVPGSSVAVTSALLNKSPAGYSIINYFDLSLNGVTLGRHGLRSGSPGVYDIIGYEDTFIDSINTSRLPVTNNLSLRISFSRPTGAGIGYIDFLTLNYEENLLFNVKELPFRHLRTRDIDASVIQYNITKIQPSDEVRVWDITDLSSIFEAEVTNTNTQAFFKSQTDGLGTVREFIAFTGNDFPRPLSSQIVANQNIRGSKTPTLLIVTDPAFKNQANRLADFRSQQDSMEVIVATTEEIYNEFSSGSQDLVAIRDCARMFFKRDPNKFKYLLLFGDCSYDYKNLRNLPNPQSLVPIYESRESLDPTGTYSSDDYVGILGDGKGDWDGAEDMDIGVGRFPVKTAQEAEAVVSKIIHYSSNIVNLGSWRQNLVFIADNGDGNVFLTNAEQLSELSAELAPNYNSKKIYIAAFPKEVSGLAPKANEQFNTEMNEGVFLLNYIGHGGEIRLSSEDIITIPIIQSLSNINKLPFVVTATCEFGKYDDPMIVSGGEHFLLHPSGGAIGLLTTTRPVYQYSNAIINDRFYRNVFLKYSGTDTYRRMGDIMRDTKNKSSIGTNNRNFAMLGDPSLRLAYPKYNIAITKVNDKIFDPSSRQDTLKAQSKVTISGQVQRRGVVATDFSGVVNVQIYDKSSLVKTVDDPVVPFAIQQNKIFDGSATVKNGSFTFSFIVPKSINYVVGNGKISMYANVEDGRLVDAGGGETRINVGSSDTNAIQDNTPPQVKVFLNDESFVNGGYTNENPTLIVKLYDENGISAIGDIGGSITATLSSNPKEEIILDNYFKSDRDSYKSGTIRYRMSNLPEGPAAVKVRAFDTNKNSNTSGSKRVGLNNDGVINFYVVKHENLAVEHVFNYPNPFTTHTSFLFDHNRAGDFLEIMVQIYTVTGKLVKTLNLQAPSASSHISDIVWDGKDEYGDNIGRGVYVYKLSVRALSDGAQKNVFEKLVILN